MASGGPSCGLRPPRGLWATVHCASCTNPRPPDPCSAPGLCDCGGRGTGARSWGSSTSTLEPQAGAPEAEPRHGHTLWGQVALLNAPAAGLSGLTSLGPGAGGDHEALGEDADAAVTVTLQPLLVHCGGGEGQGVKLCLLPEARVPGAPAGGGRGSPLPDLHTGRPRCPPAASPGPQAPGQSSRAGPPPGRGRAGHPHPAAEGTLWAGWAPAGSWGPAHGQPPAPWPRCLRLTRHCSHSPAGPDADSHQAVCSAPSSGRGTQHPEPGSR